MFCRNIFFLELRFIFCSPFLSFRFSFFQFHFIAQAPALPLNHIPRPDNALKYAKFSTLYAKDEWDDVIIFAINGGLTTMATNELLYDLGYDPLVKVLRRNKNKDEQ